jgi:hypothetical protein
MGEETEVDIRGPFSVAVVDAGVFFVEETEVWAAGMVSWELV